MLREFFGRKSAPLAGKPAVRRIKSYSAHSGYVYQYRYQGHRPCGLVTEYVFEWSADRKEWCELAILLSDDAVRAWEITHARDLSSTERYALAKLALFAAFDNHAPTGVASPLEVTAEIIASAAEQLGFVE